MPLPLNPYTPAGIAANTQVEYDNWLMAVRAEQARQEAAVAEAEAQAAAAAETYARQVAAQQAAAQQEQGGEVGGGRGTGFVDPRLIGSPTEADQHNRQTARGSVRQEPPTALEEFLAGQGLHPVVRTRAQFDAAPRDVQKELLNAAWPSIVKAQGWTPLQAAKQRRVAQQELLTATEDTAISVAGASDIALSFGTGVAGVVKSIAAAFGPDNEVARTAAAYEKQFAGAKSDGSRRQSAWLGAQLEAARKAGSTTEQMFAWLKYGLGASPGETMANLAGSVSALVAVPAMVGAAPVAGAGAAAAGTAMALGGAAGFGGVKRQAFESARDQLIEQGADPAAAARQAEIIAGSGSVTAVAAANAVVSALGGRLGAERVALRALAPRQTASVISGKAKAVAATATAEAATEVPEGLLEQLGGNIGARSAGADVGLTEGFGLAGFQSAVLGAAAGGGTHAAGSLLSRIRAGSAPAQQAQPPAAPAQPAPSVQPPAAPAQPAPSVQPPALPQLAPPVQPPALPQPVPSVQPPAVPAQPAPPAQSPADPVPPAQPSGGLPGGVGADVMATPDGYATTIEPPARINSTAELLEVLKQTGQHDGVDQERLRSVMATIVDKGSVTRADVEAGLGFTLGPRTVSLTQGELSRSAATTIFEENMSRGRVPPSLVKRMRKDGTSASEIATALSAAATTEFDRGMFAWLSTRLGDDTIKVGGIPRGTARSVMGQYRRSTADMSGPGAIVLGPSRGVNTWVIMHEMLHGATVRMLDPGAQLDENQQAARQTIDALFAHYKTLKLDSSFGGPLVDVKEFVAEGLGNHMTRGILKATKLPDTTTMWDKFRTALRGLVGLPVQVAPDNMLDALLDAVDTLSPERAASGRAALATDVSRLDAVDDLANVRGTVSDAVFVRSSEDGGGTTRGSAVLDPDTGTFQAVWHRDDGTVLRSGPIGAAVDAKGRVLPLPQQFALKSWFDDRDPNRRPVYTVDQRLSDQVLNVQRVVNELDMLAPTSRKVFAGLQKAVNLIPMANRVFTPDMLLSATRALAGLYQWGGNRYLPTDAVRDGATRYAAEMAGQLQVERGMNAADARSAVDQVLAGVGADAVVRRSARATAERTSVGGGGDKSWAQHKGDLLRTHAELQALGVPADTINDYAYAVSAIQANAIRAQEFPTDTMGYAASPDKSRFSFYSDNAGRIIPLGDGQTPPPGATLHSGVSAPFIFRTMFEQQFPNAAAKAKDMMEVVAAGNLRTLQIQLANGSITLDEFQKLRQQQYYLPMQQPKEKLKARGGLATGRRTRAENPLAQWLAVNDARIDHSAWAGSIRDIARALRLSPNPSLGVIGAHTRKLKPAEPKDDGSAPASMVDMVRLDFTGDDTVIFREGNDIFELTITDPALLRALKPPRIEGQFMERAVAAARAVTHFQAFTRTAANLSFLLAQIPIDVVTGIANAQGAWRSARDGGMVLTPAQARTMSLKLLPGMLANLGSSIKNTYNPLHTTRSPMRRLYDAHGGGVHMDARIGYTAGVDMLGGSATLGGRPGAALRRGIGAVEHGVQGIGHVWSDAIRFTGFKTYLELVHGRPFKSDAELEAFVRDNPGRLAEAVTGSKNLLGNFERTGTTIAAKAVLPFFNASVVGTTQILPQVLMSPHGRATVAAITGAVFFAALSKMQDDDDIDEDGVSKFLSGTSAWKDLVLGGNKIPLPPEFRPFIAGAVLAAAAAANAQAPQDSGFFVDKILHAMLEYMPVKVPDFDDASLMHALGIVGVPLMLSVGVDQFGKRVARDGNSVDASAPEWTQVRNTDSAFAEDTAAALTSVGLDVAPGTITTLTGQFGGAVSGMVSEMQKGSIDGRGALGAGIDWTVKRFTYDADKESQFGTSERLVRAEAALLETRDPDMLLDNRELITEQRRAITSVRTAGGLTVAQAVKSQAQARRAGDAQAYQALQEEIKDAMAQQSVMRATAIDVLKGYRAQ